MMGNEKNSLLVWTASSTNPLNPLNLADHAPPLVGVLCPGVMGRSWTPAVTWRRRTLLLAAIPAHVQGQAERRCVGRMKMSPDERI